MSRVLAEPGHRLLHPLTTCIPSLHWIGRRLHPLVPTPPGSPLPPQSVCAVDPFSRQFLRLPRPTSVDLRASCFCHKRPVDLG